MTTIIEVDTSTTTVTVTSPTTATIDVVGANTADITSSTQGLYGNLINVDTIRTVDWVQFDTAPGTVTEAEGRLWWNVAEQTLNVGLPDGVVLQVGQEQFFPPVLNNSGEVIPNGAFVMATGAQGDRVTVAKAVTDGTVGAEFMLGVATHEIAIGADDGKITTFGYVRDLDTDAWVIGTKLYPDPASPGQLTATQPDPPAFRAPIALVVRQQKNTGRIIVRMTQGSTLGASDDNVKITNPQDGDVLTYNASLGYWVNAQP